MWVNGVGVHHDPPLPRHLLGHVERPVRRENREHNVTVGQQLGKLSNGVNPASRSPP